MDSELERIAFTSAELRPGVIFAEHTGKLKPIHIGPDRQCSYMLLSTAFDGSWLKPETITINGQRVPVDLAMPNADAASGCFTIMSAQEYQQLRFHTKYDPVHIDGVPEYTHGRFTVRGMKDLLSWLITLISEWKARLGIEEPRQLQAGYTTPKAYTQYAI